MKRRQAKNGRSERQPRFVQIPYWVLETPAARSLSSSAFKVLVYVLKRYNGVNNGEISFGARSGCYVPTQGTGELKDLPIGIGKSAIAKALDELEKAGFLECTKDSSFGQKRITKEWRVTWLETGTGLTLKPATKDFAAVPARTSKIQKPVHQSGLSPKLQSTIADTGAAEVP